jgi:uncharacterized membrane protein YedE/YeeE
MTKALAQPAVALGSGLLFGFGLATAHMTDPLKVLGFLDVAGAWDASLAFVMLGAVAVTFFAFRRILRRPAPLLAEQIHLNTDRRWLAPSLLIGSAVFGIGWGISGYCPGPALAQLAAPNAETWLFLPALIVGSALSRLIGRS